MSRILVIILASFIVRPTHLVDGRPSSLGRQCVDLSAEGVDRVGTTPTDGDDDDHDQDDRRDDEGDRHSAAPDRTGVGQCVGTGAPIGAVGPHLVTGLDFGNLQIEGRLNGETVQSENTADLIHSLDFMLHYISQYFTLYPGDLIWTGTMGRTRSMEPGDTYEVEVEGVGVLRNTVVQGR